MEFKTRMTKVWYTTLPEEEKKPMPSTSHILIHFDSIKKYVYPTLE